LARAGSRASRPVQPPMEPRAWQGPKPRRDGGSVVLVDSLVIFRSDRFNLLGDLWIGGIFLLGEGRHGKADGQSRYSFAPSDGRA
jgi:hypothetical protein